MTVKPNKKIEKALKKNGFVRFATHHNRYFYISLSGKDTDIKTYISHGTKDYGDELLADLGRQLHLNKKELIRFIDGKMNQEEYESILKEKGWL